MALAERNEVLLGAAHIHTLPWQHSYTLSLYRIVLFAQHVLCRMSKTTLCQKMTLTWHSLSLLYIK